MSINESLYGCDLFGHTMAPKATGPVAEKFLFAPFSVLDARSGEWQERKRAWTAMGIKGEVGRGQCRPHGVDRRPVDRKWGEDYAGGDCWLGSKKGDTAASIFDPTLCELAYRWWCPFGGQIVDPFAGGSVRGIVAGALGMRYWGCDLRQEQITANEVQADEIATTPRPAWVCGDAITALDAAPPADFVFSCPPYGDLERYSDDPRDLSAMEWHTFTAAYRRIILRAATKLKQDRFACFVVGDFRDKRGFYRDFVGETVRAFRECGLELYNEAVLVTSVGSASMRVTKQFNAGRKLCKTHQDVLVFCKGDWRAASKAVTQ